MTITAIDLFVVPGPDDTRVHHLEQVPSVDRFQYRHRRGSRSHPSPQTLIMRVRTQDGIDGLCDVQSGFIGEPRVLLETLRENVLGENALERELLFQKLQKGTRWVYQTPGWFGAFDLCLWDIAGRAAALPVSALLGRCRVGMPVYMTAGDGPVELYIEHIERGRPLGINAYKPHSYKGGQADIPIMTELRLYVGDEFDLMIDPVCSYSFQEAVRVGRVLEELGFLWLEEPMPEQKLDRYRELCDTLTIPVMATERLMHDMDLTAQWLIHGGTDLLRGNARSGATQVLKLAHFAELHNTHIELNGPGGLQGLVHAQLGQCLENTRYYELSCRAGERPDSWLAVGAEQFGLLTTPRVENGLMVPPQGPGWGAEWDLEYLEKRSEVVL